VGDRRRDVEDRSSEAPPAWETAETTPIAPVAQVTAIVPQPLPPDLPKLFYRRGKRWPRAIAWFGFKSFWGHLWNLTASIIATEDIDSRDWMQPDTARALTRRLAETIGADKPEAQSLTEALNDDVWIDFVADTGDDFSLSKAVARLIAAHYEVSDPDADDGKKIILPRGQLLIFGGDTAYPVATDIEIHNRVIVPFNQVFRTSFDGKSRAILGVPGNHDWYAGLDGFGRMFRARRLKLDRFNRPKRAKKGEAKPAAVTPDDLEIDRLGQIGHFIEWVEAFRVGKFVVKRAALALTGYTPVQSASYWTFRIAPGVDMWGIDRQLRLVDFQQRGFFAEERDPSRSIVLCLADPVYAFLEPNPSGTQALEALDLSIKGDGLLVLTGDTHHYCRQTFGTGMQVIAGGGGAFLHPQCIARSGKGPLPDAEFPGPKTTLVLALQVPWQIAHGRSGFLVHTAMALTYIPLFGIQWSTGTAAPTTSVITAIAAMIVCLVLGGPRHKFVQTWALAAITGAVIGFLPLAVYSAVQWVVGHFSTALSHLHLAGIAFALSVYIGTLALGTYLMLLTILGLEQHQAFSALAHPGYKHFVRLRFKKDGSRADGWVFGRVDPLANDDEIVLVDQFTWKNPRSSPEGLPPSSPIVAP
jgi:hypothetical protein